MICVDTGRMPRFGGIEAEPATGYREVDGGYDPTIFALLEAVRDAIGSPAAVDYVFTDPAGQPLSQEWPHERVWLVTLRRAGLRPRGNTTSATASSPSRSPPARIPGWVAKVCGASEEMIFRYYRTWIPGLNPDAGTKGRAHPGAGSPGGLSPVYVPPWRPQR